MTQHWKMHCEKCHNPLQSEVTKEGIYVVEVVCPRCGWLVSPLREDIPALDENMTPYEDVIFSWTTPRRYRQSKVNRPKMICIVKLSYAKWVVDKWLQNNKPRTENAGTMAILESVMGYPTFIVPGAKLPAETMTIDEARQEYPDFMAGRL